MGGEGKRGVCQGTVFACECFPRKLQWNPVNTVTNGPNTFGRVNRVAILTRVFYKKVYGGFCQAAKKSSRNDEVAVRPVRRGFTLADNFQ